MKLETWQLLLLAGAGLWFYLSKSPTGSLWELIQKLFGVTPKNDDATESLLLQASKVISDTPFESEEKEDELSSVWLDVSTLWFDKCRHNAPTKVVSGGVDQLRDIITELKT